MQRLCRINKATCVELLSLHLKFLLIFSVSSLGCLCEHLSHFESTSLNDIHSSVAAKLFETQCHFDSSDHVDKKSSFEIIEEMKRFKYICDLLLVPGKGT